MKKMMNYISRYIYFNLFLLFNFVEASPYDDLDINSRQNLQYNFAAATLPIPKSMDNELKYKIQELFKKFNITDICLYNQKVKPGAALFFINDISEEFYTKEDREKLNPGEIYFPINSESEKFCVREYIDEVLKQGVSLVFTNNQKYIGEKVVYVENRRLALAEAASILYPEVPKYLIAVTGTNGKTSVVHYCRQLFTLLDHHCHSASIGTTGIDCSNLILQTFFDKEEYKALTTPNQITLRKSLQILADNAVNNVAFEASSQGIDMNRLGSIKVQAAAFTSFSQDHLDYHYTMNDYLHAKLKLFTHNLSTGSLVVLNSEIPELEYIKSFLKKYSLNIMTVGFQGDLKIHNIHQSINGQEIDFEFKKKRYHFETEVLGSFQSSNLLIACILVHHSGVKFKNIIDILPKVGSIKGRLQRITLNEHPFQVFVDYAHTPDALEKVLSELREICADSKGKLKVLFGCGGDRDSMKREIMGSIAHKLADRVIVTDNDPRCEDPVQIRQQVLQGVPDAIEIADRREAIFQTVSALQENDILLIAGKGHEDYHIIGTEKVPFSDIEIAKEAIILRLGTQF